MNMSRIRSTDTAPEMHIRRALHGAGFRYRLHAKDLPGKPDLVFRSRRSVIFVHGCYWHGHGCKRGGSGAKSNQEYWGAKIERNRSRDRAVLSALQADDWRVLVVWECETKSPDTLSQIIRFLEEGAVHPSP